MAKTTESKLGHWVFLAGFAIAIILGIVWPGRIWIASILVLLGIIVGFLNIRASEVNQFLLAAVALILSIKSFELIPAIGTGITNILAYITIFVAAAAVIVALIAVWKLASTK
jgi:hypothetical protein